MRGAWSLEVASSLVYTPHLSTNYPLHCFGSSDLCEELFNVTVLVTFSLLKLFARFLRFYTEYMHPVGENNFLLWNGPGEWNQFLIQGNYAARQPFL